MSGTSSKIVIVVSLAVVALLCVQTTDALSLAKRSLEGTSSANASEEQEPTQKEICEGRTPCGWAVYNRLTRYIDYSMRNKCECADGQTCTRDDDDISITAYVYRCKVSKAKSESSS